MFHNTNSSHRFELKSRHTFPHTSIVTCIAFSNNGQYIATGSEAYVHIFDLSTFAKTTAFVEGAFDISFSPGDRFLATATGSVIIIWDIAAKSIAKRFSGHEGQVYSIAFSPSGDWLVSGSSDETVRIWDVESAHTRLTLRPVRGAGHSSEGYYRVSISPDGRLICVSTWKGLKLFDSANGTLLKSLNTYFPPKSQSLCPTGHWLTASLADGTVQAWRLSLYNEETVPQEQIQTEPKSGWLVKRASSTISNVAWSSDGRWVLATSFNASVVFLDEEGDIQFSLAGHYGIGISCWGFIIDHVASTKVPMTGLAHAPITVGSVFATAGSDCTVRLWEYQVRPK